MSITMNVNADINSLGELYEPQANLMGGRLRLWQNIHLVLPTLQRIGASSCTSLWLKTPQFLVLSGDVSAGVTLLSATV